MSPFGLRVQAEMLHAEHHTGSYVPALDSCPEHSREEYEAKVREMRQYRPVARSEEFRLWNDQGTNKIYVCHDHCGADSPDPVRNLYEAEIFRMQHVCPEEA